ncbi:Glycosyltransferase [Rhynchospora pubera]|uniref:Glycosyltransferase n=1 Tax=Rhynchospora pubera TaxID=906938 RepID=A0AAV8C650_9POAL|nr:Glycosyltransferase [Rhynchospora pubera]
MENGKSTTSQLPHIAFLSSPGMGHLFPLAELAKRLVCHHGFSATFLTFTNFSSPKQSSFLSSLHPAISSISLPFIPLDDIPTGAPIEAILEAAVSRAVPHVRDALASLKQTTRLVAFVPDLFGVDLFPVAKELSIPHYIFFTSNCFSLLFFLQLPSLDMTTTCEYRDLPEPFLLPGCLPLPGKDFLSTAMDRKTDAYTWILRVMRGYYSAQGIFVNSFEKMEPGASEALKNEKNKYPPVYLVGPYSRPGLDESDEFHCLDWLDQQPKSSVLFVSFGSGGTLSMKQTTELAFGLEASGQRFLWVVRCPSDKDMAAFFDAQSPDDPLNYLPDGFVERTADRGMVVPSWAPQVKVLAHVATGGFLSHCGWNSTLESVSQGVPMITWPLYAEQRMNAVMLVDGAGIALRPVTQEDGLVERGDVATVVKELMDGERGKVARHKVKELQEAAISALSPEGSSHFDLTKAADQWMNSVKESI